MLDDEMTEKEENDDVLVVFQERYWKYRNYDIRSTNVLDTMKILMQKAFYYKKMFQS